MEVRNIDLLDRGQRRRMAVEAADRGEPCWEANPFTADATKHSEFQLDYEDRAYCLAGV